jgi:DNA-binding response OmpR family regulator
VRLLLVEDDERLATALMDVLRVHGFTVDRAASAAECLAGLSTETDVVVLDLGLPDRDGFEVCARIRRRADVPIVMATARGDLASRVHGLNLGADDYLVKPYDVRELMARVHAVTRRAGHGGNPAAADPGRGDVPPKQRPPVRIGEVVIDVGRRTVTVAGRPVSLTRKEFDLLELLARSPGLVFRHEQILGEVWQSRLRTDEHTLQVHVASVRAKTGTAGVIETVRGVGYRLGVGPAGPVEP